MNRTARALVLSASIGCAVSRPLAWQRSIAEGDRAYGAGRMREAAAAFERAAGETTRARDRQEAMYLAAQSLWRAGERAEALTRMQALASDPDAERAARAGLESARLQIELDDHAAAAQTLDRLVLAYPGTGPGRRALTLLMTELDRSDPSGARALERLADLAARITADTILDSVVYETARRLDAAGRTADAIAAWRRLLDVAPYPQNRHWDDGALSLARALAASGDPRGAVAVIDRVLTVRENSYGNGSYEAPRFAECAMLRASLLRDPIGDREGAAAAFHAVYVGFPVSRLRDDALREEALVRVSMGALAEACDVWERLAREFPCTRRGREGAAAAVACGRSLPEHLDVACHRAPQPAP